MRRKDQPRRPKAIICCRLSSLNTLLIPLEATLPPSVVNVPRLLLYGGFEVTLIWPVLGDRRGFVESGFLPH
jgi:hypothetical protein